MKKFLTFLAKKLWPGFETLAEPDRISLLGQLFGTLYNLPLVVVSLAWLVVVTDLDLVRSQWPVLLLMLGLGFIFSRLSYFQVIGTRAGGYDYEGSDLKAIVTVSAILLFGPTAVWLHVINIIVDFGDKWPRFAPRQQRWNWVRNLVASLGAETISFLLSLVLYQQLGGRIPLPNLTLTAIWPAFLAVLMFLLLSELFPWSMWAFRIHFQLVEQPLREDLAELNRKILQFLLVARTPVFFGILAAALYSQIGLEAYLFLMGGILLTSLLARRLSQTAMFSQQRSRELAQLEQLGRTIFAAPVDTSVSSYLPRLLAEYLPRMFAYRQAEIRLFSGQILLQLPQDRPPLAEEIWAWWQPDPRPAHFEPGEKLPWTGQPAIYPVVISPILSTQEAEPLGGICLVLDTAWFVDIVTDLRPALQVLAAQIASTFYRAEVYAQTLAHQKMTQELDFAWQIQASFLPDDLPQIEGWQLSAILKPCQETSGDFYDVFPFPNGNLGLLIADVADKGMGAALFMALSRTLIRTYAFEHPTRPDLVLGAVNQRILADTHNKMFVTVFYGILDPVTGQLIYANAGHNPPYLLKAQTPSKLSSLPKPRSLAKSRESQGLRNTGMPLGMLEGASWEAKTVELAPGDVLILYTDGITEAHNRQEELFGDQRLLLAAQANLEAPIQTIQDSILSAVDQFSKEASRCDDITLMVLKRER